MLHKLNTIEWTALALVLIGLTGFNASGQTLMHARVSHDTGGLLVRGQDGGDWSHSTINTLVLPGDTLWVDQEGLGEIEFAGGNFLRMADGSKVEVSAIDPTPTVRGWVGSFYVQRLSRSPGDFIIRTPVATLEVDKNTTVRIDILNDGATTVTVRWGRATVRGAQGGGVNVVDGQRVWIDPGLLPSDPVSFNRNQVDAFDQWNQERAAYLAGEVQTIPNEVYASTGTPAPSTIIGASSLSGHGKWVYVDNSHYWQPAVANYVPYRNGYWNYVPAYGHVWVGSQPFSYYTTHYGYWDYRPDYGWLWSYSGVWRPAHVTAIYANGNYIWTPINRHHYPVQVTDSFRFSVGGVNFSLYATSYASSAYLYNPYHVYSANHNIADYVFRNNGDVHIWNININNSFNTTNNPVPAANHARNPIRVPYNDAVQQRVRDYNPSRSVRGIAKIEGQAVQASDRVRTLELNQGRGSFETRAAVGNNTSPNTRTSTSGTARVASERSVRINPETIKRTPLGPNASVRNTAGSASAGAPTVIDRTTAPTLGNQDVNRFERSPLSAGTSGSRGSATATPAPTGQTRTPVSSSGNATSTPTTTRGNVPAPSTRQTSTGGSAVAANPVTQTRTPVPSGAAVDGRPTGQTRTPSVSVPSTNTTPAGAGATRSVSPNATPRVSASREPVRSYPTDIRSTPTAPISGVGNSVRGNYTPTTQAIPNRGGAVPPASTTTPRFAPQTGALRTPQNTPAPTPNPSRGYTAPAPSPSRGYSAPAPSAPSRSYSAPAPSAPSRSYSAPAPSAPSRSYSAPAPKAPSRNYSAPNISSSRGNSIPSGRSTASAGTSRSTAGITRGTSR